MNCPMCHEPLLYSVFFDTPLYDKNGFCNICSAKLFSWMLHLGKTIEDAVWAKCPDLLWKRAKEVLSDPTSHISR